MFYKRSLRIPLQQEKTIAYTLPGSHGRCFINVWINQKVCYELTPRESQTQLTLKFNLPISLMLLENEQCLLQCTSKQTLSVKCLSYMVLRRFFKSLFNALNIIRNEYKYRRCNANVYAIKLSQVSAKSMTHQPCI